MMAVERALDSDRPAIEGLLNANELPLDGLETALQTAVVARAAGGVVGCAAIEPYGPVGLLRSVCVAAELRGSGVGSRLVAAAEALAAERGIKDLYLLTETAESWFPRLGYVAAARSAVPAELTASPEFAGACPDSAAVLHKRLQSSAARLEEPKPGARTSQAATTASVAPAATSGPQPAALEPAPDRLPAVYLGHGAPNLIDDQLWPVELAAWAKEMPRPRSILVVSAHWQSAPLTVGAVNRAPLVYDFYGFPERYYQIRYDSPAAPDLAARIKALMPPSEPVAQRERGLDHGAYVPLLVMYPEADIPVLQMSMPDLAPQRLFEIGRRLAPLRDEGVLIMGSGFMTHGLPFVHDYWDGRPGAPEWSAEFDLWAAEMLEKGDVDSLFDFRNKAPGMPFAHPTVEHFAPLFVALGAATDPTAAPKFTIEGYWLGLAKRSFEVR